MRKTLLSLFFLCFVFVSKAQQTLPAFISGLTSSSVANSLGTITTAWVQGITKSNGDKPYAPGGTANTGISPVNINTNRDGIIAAYPNQRAALEPMQANFTLKSIITTYYKR